MSEDSTAALEKGWLKRQSDKVEHDLSTWPDWMKVDGAPPTKAMKADRDNGI